MKTKKGQYFSADAIMAAWIFVLGMVLLLNYWVSTRQIVDPTSEQLYDDTVRVSDVFLSAPNPPDWYDYQKLSTLDVRQVGLSFQGKPPVYLNRSLLEEISYVNYYQPPYDWNNDGVYNGFRTMLATGAQVYGVVTRPNYTLSDNPTPYNTDHIPFGRPGYGDTPTVKEYSTVRRVVVVDDDLGVPRAAYMDVYLYYEPKRND